MRVGRRTPLAAAAAVVGLACAVAPALTWLTATGHPGHCGWTCYRPLANPAPVAALGGRGGMQVAPAIGVLLIVVAILCALALVGALRSAGPPVALGWVLTGTSFATLVGTVVVIVRYAEGGTMVRTDEDGVFTANPGVGAIVALVSAGAAVLVGGMVALRSGRTDPAVAAAAEGFMAGDAARARTGDDPEGGRAAPEDAHAAARLGRQPGRSRS
ncbi:hypothetical protein AB0L40_06820 [Patulibacter sp. NPDC049589]|uniref:hypothetical protein n=1 Tax=Patulibacter sp. NPDC049589 TaxID=3154731 RepID=UPI00343901DF